MTTVLKLKQACIIIVLLGQCSCFILSSFELCGYLTKLECTGLQYSGSLCATNGHSYVNQCEFSKVLCTDSSLSMLHPGPCQKEKEDQQLVLSLTCSDLLKMTCQTNAGTIPYCASNGRTYSNVCYFEKARCHNNDLYLSHYGVCS